MSLGRTTEGFDVLRSFKQQLPLVGGFVLLLLVAAGSIALVITNQHFAEGVSHTLEVRSTAYRLLTKAQDAETGQRGYLLTGNTDYLNPYEKGRTEAPKALDDLRRLVSAAQQAEVKRIEVSLKGKLAELATTVALARNGDHDAALKRVKGNVGNNLMEDIRTSIESIEADEGHSEDAQMAVLGGYNKLLAAASLAGLLIVVALAGYVIRASGQATRKLLASQDELRHTNENLEELVAERVSELQMANDEIQRFAYIVSHDLRAPLVNVMGFTSELDAVRADIATFLTEVEREVPRLVTVDRRMAIETDLPEALAFIRSSTVKMDRLINAILKLSREGRRVLTPEAIDLRALAVAQGESLSQQLDGAEAKLVVADDLPGLVSDRLAVEQIFGNLIENAVKYLQKGRPGHIEVRGRKQGTYLHYDIEDNGRGIEAKDYERVFELFRRSGEQDKPGEGIGLAYVRNLARRLGGNVAVRSEFGKGSTFTVTLPAIFTARSTNPTPAAKHAAATKPRAA